jgi:hypothetical protein
MVNKNETNSKMTDTHAEDTKTRLIVFLLVVACLGVILTGLFISRIGDRSADKTKVSQQGLTKVGAPLVGEGVLEVSLTDTNQNFQINGGEDIVVASDTPGINFTNNTNQDKIGLYIPAIDTNIYIAKGETQGLNLQDLHSLYASCSDNTLCGDYEILGTIYPALFRGVMGY